MNKSVSHCLLAFGSILAGNCFAATWESSLPLVLEDKPVREFLHHQSLENWTLISAKDLLVETIFRTNTGDGNHQIVELEFVTRPRAGGGGPHKKVCKVIYSLDAHSRPSGVPSIECSET
jgi:hypothetical protein